MLARRSRFTIAGAAVAAAATMTSLAAAGGVQRQHADVTLKFGYVTGRAHPYGQTMNQFEANVEKASGGKIDIQLIPVYAGGDDQALFNDIKGGTVAGGAVSSAVWQDLAGVKAFVPLQMPFLVDSYALEEKLINNSSGVAKRMVASASQKSGLKVLGVFEGGMRHIVTRDAPINSLADLAGKKLRAVQSKPLIANMKALGISPFPSAVGNVFGGIKTGTVDGAEANSALVSTFQWDRAGANHITLMNWFPFPAVVAMNPTAFSGLSAENQKIIVDNALTLPTFSIGVVDGQANKVDLPAALCARGAKYHQLPANVRAQMVKKSQGVIKAQIRDPEVRAIYNTIVKLKAKFPKADTDLPPATCLE